jgi:hypothetical protein
LSKEVDCCETIDFFVLMKTFVFCGE